MEIIEDFIPEGEYEVEKILGYRKDIIYDEKTKEYSSVEYYLIKWLGYNEKTWEPVPNLDNCQELLIKFKKDMKKKNKKKKTSKNKIPPNTSNNINKKLIHKEEQPIQITKGHTKLISSNTGNNNDLKRCSKFPKPKKEGDIQIIIKNSDSEIDPQSSCGKTEEKEKTQKIQNKEKKDKEDMKNKNNEIIANYDENRYFLYEGKLVERPIIFDFNNIIPAPIIPAKKSIFPQFKDIFPDDDNLVKVQNMNGKNRKRNSSVHINNGINDNFVSSLNN